MEGQICFLKDISKCFRAINLTLDTDTYPGSGQMSVDFGVAILNFKARVQKVKNHFQHHTLYNVSLNKTQVKTYMYL